MPFVLRVVLALALCVHLSFSQGSVLLVGGGGEDDGDWSDAPYRWLVEHAPNRSILILHYSTTSSFLPGYFRRLGALTATNLVIPSPAVANDSATARTILAADGIFLRGGDQWQYILNWKGTLAERAIREVFQRGGVVGGSSAGMAVLSQVIVDARATSVDPRSALRNPLSSGITFTEGFLGFAPGIIGDTHFYERGRMGRLLAMIAVYKSQTGQAITGAGVDYNTALAIDPGGTGEVMGAGTVTLLRLNEASSYTLEPSKPLAMSRVLMDQLTAGYKITIPGGAITPPATATTFAPNKVSMALPPIVLDGGGQASSWTKAGGSLDKLLTFGEFPSDTIGIFSSPDGPPGATAIASYLEGKGIPVVQLPLGEGTKNDPLTAASCAGCRGFVFVSNREDSLAGFLSSSLVGDAFAEKLRGGSPVLMVSNDARLASDRAVGRTEFDGYGAYYGYLTLLNGLGLVKGIEFMPRIYENSDSIDNRFSGLFWGMGKSAMSYGVLIDDGTHIVLAGDSRLRVSGPTPALIVDARNVTSLDFPSFRDPGKANPRQNAALVGAVVHVVRDSQVFDLSNGAPLGVLDPWSSGPRPSGSWPSDKRPAGSSGFLLKQNYPNPFNPATNFDVTVDRRSHVVLEIYDMLGRRTAELFRGMMDPGTRTFRWDATHDASGCYVAKLSRAEGAVARTIILIK